MQFWPLPYYAYTSIQRYIQTKKLIIATPQRLCSSVLTFLVNVKNLTNVVKSCKSTVTVLSKTLKTVWKIYTMDIALEDGIKVHHSPKM